MLGTYLPSDVLYWIVTYLQDDSETLRSASLVSRNWVRPSQRYLLRKVFLRGNDELDTFCATVRAGAGAWSYIASLRIEVVSWKEWEEYSKVVKLTQTMTALKSVYLSTIEWPQPEPDAQAYPKGGNSVCELTLANTVFDGNMPAFVALQTFPALRDLTLQACRIEERKDRNTPELKDLTLASPLHLDKLMLDQCADNSFAPLFVYLFAESPPNHLYVKALYKRELALLHALCESIRKNVHHLHFVTEADSDDFDLVDELPDLNVPHLRSLHFEFFASDGTKAFPLKGTDLGEVLFEFPRDINATELELIDFDLRQLGGSLIQDDSSDEDEDDWVKIKETIKNSPSSAKARVFFAEEQAERKVVTQLKNGFSDPEMQGLVHVHIGAGSCVCNQEDPN